MKIIYAFCALFLAAAISGCVHPMVTYSKVSGPDPEGAIKFKFAHSMLVTTPQLDKSDNITGYTIQSVPVAASADPKYAIRAVGWTGNWGVETILNATYLEGSSDLLKEIGVSVKDDRVAIITDLGSIAAAVFAMAAEGQKQVPQQPPEPVDVSQFLKTPMDLGYCKADGNDRVCHSEIDQYGWKMYIRINPLPDDRLDSKILNSPYSTNSYLYSACRNAQVSLKWTKDGKESGLRDTIQIAAGKTIILPKTTVQIADPNYLEALAFPTSGKVIARASCGAESTTSDAKTSNAFDIISALVKAAQTAKDAKDGKTSK